MSGFRGLTLTSQAPIRDMVSQGMCGGVILFDRDVLLESDQRNIQSREQVQILIKDLQALASKPLLVAVDQEGGRVARLGSEHGFPSFPSAASLGATDNLEATRKAGADIGRTLAAAGFNLNLAPVVDVNTNPDNPAIGRLDRSFSAQPEQVTAHAAAFIRGLHQEGILSCIKHFPGHGSAFNDSHLGMTEITQTWDRFELMPYARLIDSGLCDLIMTGHLVHQGFDPRHPATLSQPMIQGLLRRDLGFDGVVITDDLQMKAITEHYRLQETIRLAITAGADILLFGNNLEYEPRIAARATSIIVDLVRNGDISRQRIQTSYARIMKLKHRLGSF